MILYHNDGNDHGMTPIDGYKMVEDLYFLFGLQKRCLPLEINRDWHPTIKEIYNQVLSGVRTLPEGTRISKSIYDTDFYVYERDPIDDWEGYYQLFLEDLLEEGKWRNLVYHTFKILKENSSWEQDVIAGPFIAMHPGDEMSLSHWVVLLKQENNGDTYVISRYPLEHLDDFLIKCHIANKK